MTFDDLDIETEGPVTIGMHLSTNVTSQDNETARREVITITVDPTVDDGSTPTEITVYLENNTLSIGTPGGDVSDPVPIPETDGGWVYVGTEVDDGEVTVSVVDPETGDMTTSDPVTVDIRE